MAFLFAACTGTEVGAESERNVVAPGETLMGNYLAGRHAQMMGDVDAAITYLGAALEQDPDATDLLRRAFLVNLSDGRIAEALPLARRIPDVMPGDSLSVITLAVDDIAGERYAEARERLDGLGTEGINGYVAPLLAAWSLVGEGDTETALDVLAPLGRSGATEGIHATHAALVHALRGEPDEAEKLFQQVTEHQGAITLRTAELMGRFYEQQDAFDRAIAIYEGYRTEHPGTRLLDHAVERAGKQEPPDGPLITAQQGAAEALFGIASSLRQQNAPETGLLLARLGLHLWPEFPALKLVLGDTLEVLARYDDANEVYRSLPRTSDYWWSAQMRVASNLDIVGETDKAIALLRTLAEENPTNPAPLITLGDILRGEDEFGDAVRAYDGAFERIGEIGPQHWSLLYARGIALERSKNWERAEADFLKALEFQPEQPYVLNYLGYSWVEKRVHLDRAKDMIRKAVELRPNDGYIVDSLGWVHYQLGDYEMAVEELERAVELRPEDPVINDHLGDAYWRVGRYKEARFQWQRSLGLEPDPETAAAIESKLENGLAGQQPVSDGDG